MPKYRCGSIHTLVAGPGGQLQRPGSERSAEGGCRDGAEDESGSQGVSGKKQREPNLQYTRPGGGRKWYETKFFFRTRVRPTATTFKPLPGFHSAGKPCILTNTKHPPQTALQIKHTPHGTSTHRHIDSPAGPCVLPHAVNMRGVFGVCYGSKTGPDQCDSLHLSMVLMLWLMGVKLM